MSKSKNPSEVEVVRGKTTFADYWLIAITSRGDHDVNQDSYSYFAGGDRLVVSVADGLGSARKSDRGSSLATRLVCEEDWDEFSIKKLYSFWKTRFPNERLQDFDTTIRVVNIREDNVHCNSIGDGGTYISADDQESHLLQSESDFANQTRSLISISFGIKEDEYQLQYENRLFLAIFTDGFEQVVDVDRLDKLGELIQKMIDVEDLESLKERMEDWVASWFSLKAYDDKTLIMLYVKR